MRVLRILLALLSVPFALSTAQGKASPNPFADPANCGKHLQFSSNATTRGNRPMPVHGGAHGVMDLPCGGTPEPTPPPSSPSIEGQVFNTQNWQPLSGWVVQVSGSFSASATTDADGNYVVSGLPAGDYVICLVIPEGWYQTMPTMAAACPSGMGYTFSLADGEFAQWVNFGAQPQ